ncbi:MAG: hypothetical protein V1872_14975 [bacterium]
MDYLKLYQVFLYFQITLDLVIVAGFLYLLTRLSYKKEEGTTGYVSEEEMESLVDNLNELVEEFQGLSKKTLDNIADKVKTVDKTSRILDKKIEELKNILSQANIVISTQSTIKNIVNDKMQERRTKVIELKKQGMGLKEISKMLEIPEGEVNLILNLKKDASEQSIEHSQDKNMINAEKV